MDGLKDLDWDNVEVDEMEELRGWIMMAFKNLCTKQEGTRIEFTCTDHEIYKILQEIKKNEPRAIKYIGISDQTIWIDQSKKLKVNNIFLGESILKLELEVFISFRILRKNASIQRKTIENFMKPLTPMAGDNSPISDSTQPSNKRPCPERDEYEFRFGQMKSR